MSPQVARAAEKLLQNRCGNETPRKMIDIAPDSDYKDHEMGREDDFYKTFGSHNYAAYTGSVRTHSNTEILSMGLQLLYNDPAGFAKRDPEYFKFTVGVIHGKVK